MERKVKKAGSILLVLGTYICLNQYVSITVRAQVLNNIVNPIRVEASQSQNINQVELIVKFKENANYQLSKTNNILSSAKLDNLNAEYGLSLATNFTKKDAKHKKGYFSLGLDRIHKLTFDSVNDIAVLIDDYKKTGLFEAIDLNGVGKNNVTIEQAPLSVSTTHAKSLEKMTFTPNDTLLYRQWYVKNDGTFPNTWDTKEGADMDIDLAWDITTGDSATIVAIIGSGIAMNEPDFEGRLWINKNEIPANSIDDDNNGYVDDIHGWEFIMNWGDVEDITGYGTSAAGLIGANGNNITAYAGVDWKCKFMNLGVLDFRQNGKLDHMIASIIYAVDNGADIIDLTIGVRTDYITFHDAVKYAYQNDIAIITCMPLGMGDAIDYPGAYPETITVGATDVKDRHYSYDSTTSDYVDLVAPGRYIHPIDASSINPYPGTWWYNGPAVACDLVTGVASLLLGLDPTLKPEDIRHVLTTTADDTIGRVREDVPGWDKYHGWGRVNAFKAVNYLVTGVADKSQIPSDFELSQNYPNPFNPTTAINYVLPKTTEVEIMIYNLNGQLVHKSNLGKKNAGKNSWSWIPYHDLASGIYILRLQAGEFTESKKMILAK